MSDFEHEKPEGTENLSHPTWQQEFNSRHPIAPWEAQKTRLISIAAGFTVAGTLISWEHHSIGGIAMFGLASICLTTIATINLGTSHKDRD